MHIKELAAAAIKGRTFTHALTPLVLISGPNFSGKTTRLDAIQIALMGHSPKLGRTAKATDLIASGGRVRLTFDNGDYLDRDLASELASSLTDAQLAALNTPLLDASEYFAAGPADRIRYIFTRGLAGEAGDWSKLVAEIERLNYPDTTDAIVEARREASELVSEMFGVHEFADALNLLTAPTTKKGIIPTKVAYYRQRADETIGTVRTLTELKLREEECSAQTIESLEQELAALRDKGEAAKSRMNTLTTAQMQVNSHASKLEALRTQLQKAKAESETPGRDYSQEIKDLRQRLAEAPPEPDNATVTEQINGATRSHAGAANVTRNAEVVVERLTREIALVEAAEPCPHCGAKPTKQRTKEMAAKLAGEYKEAQLHLQESREIETATQQALNTAKEAMAQASETIRARFAITSALTTTERAELTQRHTAQQLAATVRHLEEQIEHYPEASVFRPEDLQAATDEYQRARVNYAEVDERRKAAIALQQDLRRAAEAHEEHHHAKAAQLVFSDTLAILKAAQVEAIDNLFADLLKTANFFAEGILPSPIAFEKGEIGRRDGLRFISHKTFSGTEEAIVYVAIAAALSRRLSFRLAMIDELGRLDDLNKTKLLARLQDAVATGYLDQVIVCDPEPTGTLAGDWTHIALP